MKKCTKCERHLPSSRFGSKKHVCKDGSVTYSKRSRCRDCTNEDNLKRYHSNDATKKAHNKASYNHRIKSYGMTIEEYEQMYKKQEGKCACCEVTPDRQLNIDHCHKTGKIRALLCHNCNTAIGHAKESIEVLNKLIKYLQRHE